MVQQEVKKKTRVYGTVAALSAMVLVALIFVFGSTPGLIPSFSEVSGMRTFNSYDELREYLVSNTQGNSQFAGGPLDSKFFGERADAQAETALAPSAPSNAGGFGSDSYSTTNIQVAGVDEADIVKNDGAYIYVASNDYSANQNYIYILKADPQDPRVIARITLDNDTYLAGMYLNQDKLVVIGSQYQYTILYGGVREDTAMPSMLAPYQSDVKTFINVYDISDKVHPTLARNLTLTGSYFNSRMIGNYVYTVVSQSAYVYENTVTVPKVYGETGVAEVAPSRIYYADTMPSYFAFTTFIGLNVIDETQELANMTVLMGGASTMYVSLDNIYVTYPTWSDQGEYTSIYRIRVEENEFDTIGIAKGSVPGYVLNQYSMDEYNNYFRLATTSQKETSKNSVYVLDMNLTAVGELRLQNAEARETIFSARFIGDKAYIVTFEQKDPFFVVDLSDPTAPKEAGKLEIPGYSSYLHPYDENHVIGLGMENSTVKLSLFDVTNVNAPTEIARYIVQGDYSSSDALYEPKAFLFDKAKQLLVIPVSITQYGVVGGGDVIPPVAPNPSGKDIDIAPMQGGYWQGAYVFTLTLTGFELEGGVTHQENTNQQYYYGDYNQNVNRALYIGNTLYTVSNAKVKLNSLTDLTQIAEIKLT